MNTNSLNELRMRKQILLLLLLLSVIVLEIFEPFLLEAIIDKKK